MHDHIIFFLFAKNRAIISHERFLSFFLSDIDTGLK